MHFSFWLRISFQFVIIIPVTLWHTSSYAFRYISKMHICDFVVAKRETNKKKHNNISWRIPQLNAFLTLMTFSVRIGLYFFPFSSFFIHLTCIIAYISHRTSFSQIQVNALHLLLLIYIQLNTNTLIECNKFVINQTIDFIPWFAKQNRLSKHDSAFASLSDAFNIFLLCFLFFSNYCSHRVCHFHSSKSYESFDKLNDALCFVHSCKKNVTFSWIVSLFHTVFVWHILHCLTST